MITSDDKELLAGDHFVHDNQVVAEIGQQGGGDHDPNETHLLVVPATDLYASLRKMHRIRQFAMEARKRSDLALGALLRQQLGWWRGAPKVERDAIAAHALALIACGEKTVSWENKLKANPTSKAKAPAEPEGFDEWRSVILASIRSREPMSRTEDAALAQLEALAEQLPVAPWFKANVFKTLRSLAVVVAETGDLSNYATVSKVWKRFGVAVLNGKRQGGLSKTAPKDEWIEHGYVRRRRSLLFVIGEALIKGNEHYRSVYLGEKERQRSIAKSKGLKVVPAARIPKSKADEFMSDGHVHNRARRYMEKMFLMDLWYEWQRCQRQDAAGAAP